MAPQWGRLETNLHWLEFFTPGTRIQAGLWESSDKQKPTGPSPDSIMMQVWDGCLEGFLRGRVLLNLRESQGVAFACSE